MSRKNGKEMKRLMIAVSVTMLILVVAIVAYFVIDVTLTTNRNMEENKTKMIESSVLLLKEVSSRVLNMQTTMGLIKYFDQSQLQAILKSGDFNLFYEMAVDLAVSLYPVEYAALFKDGKILAYQTSPGVVVDPTTMPVAPPPGLEYTTSETLGNKQGFFVSLFYDADLGSLGFGNFQAQLVVDRTKELADIESYFNNQRNSLLLAMLIAAGIAIILTILLTTLGLRYFTRKYVVDPIEKLNTTAEQIMDGTYEGDVEVDDDSAFRAIQALLRSGQKVLCRMDEQMDE
jgi:hypothetical protein